MKYPHTKEIQDHIKILHKEYLQKYKQEQTKQNLDDIHTLMESILQYDNVDLYNKYHKSRCMFSNSDDTEKVCEGKFRNTFNHFTKHGNCCKTCSNIFIAKSKLNAKQNSKKKEVQNSELIHTKELTSCQEACIPSR